MADYVLRSSTAGAIDYYIELDNGDWVLTECGGEDGRRGAK